MVLKQVFIVNNDLKMGKGKIAVQVAHGEVFYVEEVIINNVGRISLDNMDSRYCEWTEDGLMKKVVLKATQEEMLILIGILEMMGETEKIWYHIVFDRGLTQVPADSMTCIVIEPLDEEIADNYFGHLKLL